MLRPPVQDVSVIVLPDAPEGAFYLQPARKPTPTCWFSRKPLGQNTLAKTVSAGIEG